MEETLENTPYKDWGLQPSNIRCDLRGGKWPKQLRCPSKDTFPTQKKGVESTRYYCKKHWLGPQVDEWPQNYRSLHNWYVN